MSRKANEVARKGSRRGFRIASLATTLAVGASVLTGVGIASAASPPPNPSDSQISSAQAQKNQMASQVGTLQGQVVQAQNQLNQLSAAFEAAEQKYALAVSQLRQAQSAAAAAKAQVTAATKAVSTARSNLTQYVHNSYISTSNTGSSNLLTASDPNALLQRGNYQSYVTDKHIDAMSALNKATIAKSNADAAAKSAVQRQQQLTAQAAAAQQAAQAAYQQQQDESAQLQASLASYQTQLSNAQAQLATLNGERATYLAYQKEQARLAAIKAAKEKAAREAAARAAAAARLRQQQEAAAAAAAAAANNSGGGSAPVAVVSNPPAAAMGSWNAAKGVAAVQRAERYLGTPYAWAGGNANGPTYGVNSPGTAGYNDSSVYGFDCSGLTLYAWAAEGLYMAHYAATQYTQAGSFHPSSSQFQPGDLLFWSSNGTIAGIHHVAMYIGGGNVIQAPNSGDVVKITPWDQVDWGYYGATRPLT